MVYSTILRGTLFLFLILSTPAVAKNPQYLSGFGNEFSSEAIEGALPQGQNSPQKCPYGLYAEQLSGTSFTTPRADNRRIWLYRIHPSVCHSRFEKVDKGNLQAQFGQDAITPNQLLWKPFPFPEVPTDFVAGITTIAGTGSPNLKAGTAIHIYAANRSMENACLCNADGDLLILPQVGGLNIQTECGLLDVKPGEICVIPRGMRFRVALDEDRARGYLCEVYGGHFRLPDLGPIGANGLANPRDFLTPVAAYEDREVGYRVFMKFSGELFAATMRHSPFDVVAYHGNYVPYKYDLSRFCPMNTVSFDHADPSIFTVLTCPTQEPGVAAVDFVVFPPRWVCAEHTFRPPYFHRNCMSEYMGIIKGTYEAKKERFLPGGASLHSCMTPHGPDTKTFEAASEEGSSPTHLPDDALAFMFESTYLLTPTAVALQQEHLDTDYPKVWEGLVSHFPGTNSLTTKDQNQQISWVNHRHRP